MVFPTKIVPYVGQEYQICVLIFHPQPNRMMHLADQHWNLGIQQGRDLRVPAVGYGGGNWLVPGVNGVT